MTSLPTPSPTSRPTDDLDRRRVARVALRTKHAENLTRLMEERTDLRGVHALADFVDEAVRWTA